MKLEELKAIETHRKNGESINDVMERITLEKEVSCEIETAILVPDEEGFLDNDIIIPRYKINQPTTRTEGAKEGHFRNVLTGEEHQKLESIVFLKRSNGRILFKEDDYSGFRECWSNDGLVPSEFVVEKTKKEPRCNRCTTMTRNQKIVHCPFAIWNGNPPQCKEVINFLGADSVGTPFWISFHGSALPIIKSFLGCIYLQKKKAVSQGKNLNLRDFRITMALKLKVSPKGKFYIPVVETQEYIKESEERKYLEELFTQLNQKNLEETITAEEEINTN